MGGMLKVCKVQSAPPCMLNPTPTPTTQQLTWRVEDGAASTALQTRGMSVLATRESPSSWLCIAASSTCNGGACWRSVALSIRPPVH